MLDAENTSLIVIDVQEKLSRVMWEKERFFENLRKLIRGAVVLEIPVIWTEQNPAGLGPTVKEIAGLVPDFEPIAKVSFSCWGEEKFQLELQDLNRKQALLAGIETHVCVYQTVVDLVEAGYEVGVVADTVASRTSFNNETGLQMIRDAGGAVTSVETALFELLKVADGPQFKQILDIVK